MTIGLLQHHLVLTSLSVSGTYDWINLKQLSISFSVEALVSSENFKES
jgi:hypothetical protein